MAISKTPKTLPPEDQRTEDRMAIADAMNAGETQETERAAEPTLAELYEKIGAMNAELASLKERENLMLQPVPAAPAALTPPKPLSFDGLPDPVTDKEGYARALADRIAGHQKETLDYENRVRSDATSHEDRVQEVFEDIATRHPELADDNEKLDFIMTRVVKRAMKRGIDKDRYVFGQRDRFIADVKSEYEKTFGPLGDEEDEPAPRTRRARDSGRGEVILGGADPRPKGGREQTQPTSDFMRELTAARQKLGLL